MNKSTKYQWKKAIIQYLEVLSLICIGLDVSEYIFPSIFMSAAVHVVLVSLVSSPSSSRMSFLDQFCHNDRETWPIMLMFPLLCSVQGVHPELSPPCRSPLALPDASPPGPSLGARASLESTPTTSPTGTHTCDMIVLLDKPECEDVSEDI